MKRQWGATKLTYNIVEKVKGKLMNEHFVFVYGTLKRKHYNHHLLKDSEFIGEAWTDHIYTMYDGAFPYITRNGGSYIYGELYRVTDEEVMKNLDRLEGVPDHYVRDVCRVHEGGEAWDDKWFKKGDGRFLKAIVYVASDETHQYIIDSGREPMKGVEVFWSPFKRRDEFEDVEVDEWDNEE